MKIYIIFGTLLCGAVFGAYIAGQGIARANCRTVIELNYRTAQTKIINETEKIKDETLHTAVRDIRCILRQKYTIAQ